MNHVLDSKSFGKPTPAVEVNAALQELVAAMPIVLFFNAVRTAFGGKKNVPAVAARAAR